MTTEADTRDGDREDARERLFDVLLREECRGHDDAGRVAAGLLRASAAQRDAAHRRAQAASTPPIAFASRWWMTAVALLGVGVVTATMLTRPQRVTVVQLAPQDPQPAREAKPRDVAHFVALLPQVTALHVGGMQAVGATTTVAPNQVTNVLEHVCWPETFRVDGEALLAWRRACAASVGRAQASGAGSHRLALHFVLADGSHIEACWESGRSVLGDGWELAPNDELAALLAAAAREAELRHRIARGEARDADELAALPADSRRVECPWFADGKMGERLERFPQLETFVLAVGPGPHLDAAGVKQLAAKHTLTSLDLRAAELAAADLAPLAELPSLASLAVRGQVLPFLAARSLGELTLVGCRVSGDDLSTLARDCKRLRTLRVLDCELPDSPAFFGELASFSSLAHLALRQRELPQSMFAALARGKLQSLRLVDVPVRGSDLAKLAELPSLRELAVLSPTIDDGDVGDIAALRQLTTLRLQNVKVTRRGLDELREALPKCAIDCVPGRRVFDSGIWILP